MRIGQSVHQEYGRRVVALAAGLAMSLGIAGPASAFNPQPEPPGFGMVGLGRFQIAVLYAVLITPPDRIHPGCAVELSFVDGRGQLFHDRAGNEVKKTVRLRDNVAVALTLRASDILAADEIRKPIRPVVTDAPDDGTPSDCQGMVATAETVASSGWAMTIQQVSVPRGPVPPPTE